MNNSKEKTYYTFLKYLQINKIFEKTQSTNIETYKKSTYIAINVTSNTSHSKVERIQDNNKKNAFLVSKKQKICLIIILFLMIKITLISIGLLIWFNIQTDQTENIFKTKKVREGLLGWRYITPCQPVMGPEIIIKKCIRNTTDLTKENTTSSYNVDAMEIPISPKNLRTIIANIFEDCNKTEDVVTENFDTLKNLHTFIEKNTKEKVELCWLLMKGFLECMAFRIRLFDLYCSCLEKESELFRVDPSPIGNNKQPK